MLQTLISHNQKHSTVMDSFGTGLDKIIHATNPTSHRAPTMSCSNCNSGEGKICTLLSSCLPNILTFQFVLHLLGILDLLSFVKFTLKTC